MVCLLVRSREALRTGSDHPLRLRSSQARPKAAAARWVSRAPVAASSRATWRATSTAGALASTTSWFRLTGASSPPAATFPRRWLRLSNDDAYTVGVDEPW